MADLPEKRPEIREEMDKTDEEERDNVEESPEKHTNGVWRPTYRRAGHGPAGRHKPGPVGNNMGLVLTFGKSGHGLPLGWRIAIRLYLVDWNSFG